ncbi:FAD:protein FMN transferase [Singulisphaera acidiphila]|uniref:FAD:protein FMN transferase n=1 Tax=Singulisphaera acidiphila (strain ATCC BAA-1392 / DSM 18658 / VKM B-2454 / MOB10) TaxID=886293 RepID=L0DDV9_SINAD|nr:FAD:protein FMN transferase [Singulisphaera acidiphila]AGA27013.1 membrane-associated lipoprotein involved in thiamine biosynthesis [Singulisphaera acidiphila DSM 18658]
MIAPLSLGFLLVLQVVGASLDAEPTPKLSRFDFAETHMGTSFNLVLYTEDEPTARSASQAAFARIAALDAILSDYQPESELMRLCRQAGGPPVPVSEPLFEVLARSKAIYEQSHGAFDVTVAPVVRLWRRARRDRKMPDLDRLAEALALVGSDKMLLDPVAKTVQLTKPSIKLDLGGLAKGYAADEALRALKAKGVTRALVAGAGDIVVGDPPPGRDGWTIGVAALNPGKDAPRCYLSLSRAAVSTAGDAEQFVEIDGKRYSHIVDPRTGLGVVNRSNVTVFARDGLTADSLDTAIYVLGPERGLPLVESTDEAAALIVRLSPKGEETIESQRWGRLPTTQPKPNEKPVLSRP